MTCQNIQSAINETIYGRMQSPGFNDNVRQHLDECTGCQQHVSEMSRMASLIGGLPRVSAPADFDFKLRARIARAKSEQQQATGWLAGLVGRSFSWAQAGMSMAAIALIVGISTYSLLPRQATTVENRPQVATISSTSQNKAVEASQASTRDIPTSTVNTSALAQVTSVSSRVQRTVVPHAKNIAPSESRPVETANLVAANPAPARNTILIKGARGNGVQMVAVPDVQEVTYGAQTVSFRQSQTKARSNEELTAAVIF